MRLTLPRAVVLGVLLLETSYLLMTLKKVEILEEECLILQEDVHISASNRGQSRGVKPFVNIFNILGANLTKVYKTQDKMDMVDEKQENQVRNRTYEYGKSNSSAPTIYVVTPTYKRMTQMADMTRLAQTLTNVDNIHWIVVEDAQSTSEVIHDLLVRTGLPYTHLSAVKPPDTKDVKWLGRGVFNRREGLRWLREEKAEGVLYFADDDNSYDVRIFEQMRSTQKVSVFPVGMILGLGISSPIVRNGKVEAFHDGFQHGRKFSVDMAGFAVNLRLLHINPDATIPTRVSYLEDGFLRKLRIDIKDLEPLADGCTEVLVWHTKTRSPATPDLKHVDAQYVDTNLYQLYRNMLR